MPTNFPYDLLVNDCVKIDVKASKLYNGKQGSFYSYRMGKPFATCDFYLLFAINNDMAERIMVVPSNHVITNHQISVGEHDSIYHKYIDKWELISSLSEFWNKLSCSL